MTGSPLHLVPREQGELARLYHELAAVGGRVEGRRLPWRQGRPSPEEVVVLAAQAARHDARLNPLLLRRAARRARWPATIAVALEFARRAAPSRELDDYAALVTAEIAPAGGERFFLGTRAFAGAQARRDAEESLAEYKRWGYLAREEPFAKELGVAARGTMERAERLNLLRRLAARRGTVTLAEYRSALRGRVSDRQASRDLREAEFLEKVGRTRGARWRLTAGSARPEPVEGRAGPRARGPTGSPQAG